MSQLQNYEVNYSINVEARGIEHLKAFGESVQKINQAKLSMNEVVGNIQKTMDGIDKVFRDRNGKRRKFDYALNIDTKGTEARLKTISGLLDEIGAKSKGIKLTIAAGKPLTARQVRANAKNIVDQNREIVKLTGATALGGTQSITGTIERINTALSHLQAGHEVNIKTETATGRLNELLTLLGRVRSVAAGAVTLGAVMTGGVLAQAAPVPFNPAPYVYNLPKGAAGRISERLARAQALHEQRLAHTDQNTAARIRAQAETEAARLRRQAEQQAARQQAAEIKRQAAMRERAQREAQKIRQKANVNAIRERMRADAHAEGVYSRTRQAAVNRLQYSRPPSIRTMLPFGYMLNGYMLLSTMRSQTAEAVEYANMMESARSILRVTDGDLGTFEARFSRMARNVRTVGIETKFTAVEVAGAVRYLAMAGQGIETINKSIRPITNLALIGDNDLDTIADLTTNIMAGYDISPDSMPSVADIIASTISRSNVNIIETAESFKMAAGTLRMAGIDFTEASAAIGLLGNMGLKGTMSGTSLRAIATRLASPTKGTREALDRMGVSFKERVNMYGNEIERFRPLADIFEDLNRKGATLEDMHKIFGVRGANAGMMFLQNYQKLRTLTANNRASQGVSDELAKVKQETTKGLWYQMTSMFSESFMQGYETMEPQIQSVLKGFIEKFRPEVFAKGLASLGGAMLDIFRVLGNIAAWVGRNFTWLGPTVFTGVAATRLFKLAGAVTNLGVALGFLGKKAVAAQGIQSALSLAGFGGLRLRPLSFGDRRTMVTALRGMGVAGGRGAMTRALASAGLAGGLRGAAGRTAASVFATQVATGGGIVGAGASLGALGSGAVVAAGALGILAAAIGMVAYKTWKMQDIHRSVIADLEKKEKYSFPALEQLNGALGEAYTRAKAARSQLDELTRSKNLIEQTGQPMGAFSPRGWTAFFNGFVNSERFVPGLKSYTYTDAYQDNITEALTTLARQEAVETRRSFYGELGRQRTATEIASFVEMMPKTYLHDLTDVNRKLYRYYDEKTGVGTFVDGLKNRMTVGEGLKTGVYKNWLNQNLYPELAMRAELYRSLITSQSNAENWLGSEGKFDFGALREMGFKKNAEGVWEQNVLPGNATDAQKQEHLTNYRTVHRDLVLMMGTLREFWGGSGEAAENIMRAAGFPAHLFSNEPDREDMAPWNKPGISAPDGGDDGGAGGDYSGSGKLSSAAPKQVIVNITNLLSIETVELLRSESGNQPEIQDLKEQMAQALIDVVHDFDASWNGA
jgi:TP901 family phage tail tape measure protein